MACFYSRLKNSKEAYNNVKGLLIGFSRENLFTMSPAGVAGAESDIFEFDANEAAPAAIAEMLVQSHEGYIEFLPALPDQWKTGSFKGLCVLGGGVVDLKWTNKNIEIATIRATTNQNFKIKLAADNRLPKLYKNSKPIIINQGTNGILSFSLNKGESVDLKYE